MVRLGAVCALALLGVAAGVEILFGTPPVAASAAQTPALVLNETPLNLPQTPNTSTEISQNPIREEEKAPPPTHQKEEVKKETTVSPPPAPKETITTPAQALTEALEQGDAPARLVIPSIHLDTSIVGVGLTSNGEMDVPDGSTQNVGWYKYGTIPGNVGSAVMDAHVYAAFENLRYAKVGDEVRIVTKSGRTLKFKITDSMVYSLAEVPLQYIFNRKDDRRLNFITCARQFSPALNTYTHRLVVYTTFVGEE